MQRLRPAVPFRQTCTCILRALVCVAFLTGCKFASEPLAPPHSDPTTSTPPFSPGPQGTNASVAGFVIDESDQCIIGARVEMIDGPRPGAVFEQTVCGFWDYGEDLGYSFHNLPIGIAVTVRATAKGYLPAEKRVVPTNPYSYTNYIVLKKEQ